MLADSRYVRRADVAAVLSIYEIFPHFEYMFFSYYVRGEVGSSGPSPTRMHSFFNVLQVHCLSPDAFHL